LLVVHSDRLKKFNPVQKNDGARTLEIVEEVNKKPSLVKEPRYNLRKRIRMPQRYGII
jgi:hypothetical protein